MSPWRIRWEIEFLTADAVPEWLSCTGLSQWMRWEIQQDHCGACVLDPRSEDGIVAKAGDGGGDGVSPP